VWSDFDDRHRDVDLISDALPFFFPELRSAVFLRTSWNGSHQPASQQTKTFLHYYETNKEAVDQTDAEKRADLFRVHLLRRRGLMT
jgi:hypothetical protein